jgi:2-polyprenyl-3-methyl-5-hydroxy-6-metoxy-1,4-benzoquinol methylase
MHSLNPGKPDDIYDASYWGPEHSHSTLREQVFNIDEYAVDGVTKAQFVCRKLESAPRGSVLEIGCAPGIMLRRLAEMPFGHVHGIEFIGMVGSAKEIREIGQFQGPLTFTNFPEGFRDRLQFSAVVALDTFEHSFTPELFLHRCWELLEPGGVLLLMLPIMGENFNPRMFHPVEHVWLHTEKWMRDALEEVGFGEIEFDRWTHGHETVRAKKL